MSDSEEMAKLLEQETADFPAIVLAETIPPREMKDLRVIDRASDLRGWRIEASIEGAICTIHTGSLHDCIAELAYRETLFASTGYYE
jgi:hypothetical protein